MDRLTIAILAGVMTLSAAPWASAAYISEIDLTPRAAGQPDGTTVTLPPLIEISGLTNTKQIELLIVNAQDRFSAYGHIKQVIRLGVDPAIGGSNGTGVMVVTDPAWPEKSVASILPQTVIVLPAGQVLDFGNLAGDARAVLLLSPWTNWSPGAKFGATAAEMKSAQVLDYLTFGPATSSGVNARARSYAEEPVLDPAAGSVIERPTSVTGGPAAREFDVIGFPAGTQAPLLDYVPTDQGYYALTPGIINPVPASVSNPEPASLALLALGVAALVCRRGRSKDR